MSAPSLEQRLAPRNRPEASVALHQTWSRLLFLHWKVDAAELSKHLPPGVVLDLFDDQAWLGIVPFFMQGVRPRGLPAVPGLSSFLELNVRTYVHDDQGVPGVWFFSLDASNAIACSIARSKFHLPYRDAAMTATEENGWIDYECRRNDQEEPANYRYRPQGEAHAAEPGSLEFFLAERYYLYAHDDQSGRLFRGQVHHTPYPLQEAEVPRWSTLPVAWDKLHEPEGEPDHVCFAQEVKVDVFKLETLPGE